MERQQCGAGTEILTGSILCPMICFASSLKVQASH